MIKPKLLSLLVACLFSSGCLTTSTITNLTPSKLPRNVSGLYLFEIAFDTNQRTLRRETIRPSVMIGQEFFPMQPAPLLKNRWEGLAPIPADQKLVYYQFKLDFEYDSLPRRQPSSRLTPPYKLDLLDK